jgi:hypothetical protein
MNEEKKSPDAFVGLDDEAGVVEVLKTSVFGPWQVVNNLTRLRPSRRSGNGSCVRMNVLQSDKKVDDECIHQIDKKTAYQRHDDKRTVGGTVLLGNRRHVDDSGRR